MEVSKLKDHKLKKGKFITPLNEVVSKLPDTKNWEYGRRPEYLWIGLILKKYGRELGIKKIYNILEYLKNQGIENLKTSTLLDLEKDKQINIFKKIKEITGNSLEPLTVIFTHLSNKEFNKVFFENEKFEKRVNILKEAMDENSFHQSPNATDIRYIVLVYNVMRGKISNIDIEKLRKYPTLSHEEEEMRTIRPYIRSTELALLHLDKVNERYIGKFWDDISKITECHEMYLEFEKKDQDINLYLAYVYEIFYYLKSTYQTINPLSEKMEVILGISTYFYKRFREIAENKMFDTIIGRSNVRVLVENYILLKYILKIENGHENIWRDYKYYGIGVYKLILGRDRDNEGYSTNDYIDMKYIELLVNEFQNEEFIDMDTRYFDNHNIKKKAEIIEEKYLFGLHYDYGSSYEHSLWGAIRESSMLKCTNPGHRYHTVPDIDNITKLKSTMKDSVYLMNKIINILDQEFGIPSFLLKEVKQFEKHIEGKK